MRKAIETQLKVNHMNNPSIEFDPCLREKIPQLLSSLKAIYTDFEIPGTMIEKWQNMAPNQPYAGNGSPAMDVWSIFVLGMLQLSRNGSGEQRSGMAENHKKSSGNSAIQFAAAKAEKKKARNRYKITPRQLEVLKWLGNGKSTWEISVILSRSESVIKWHVKNILEELCAVNRTQAVAIAMRHGLIE